MTECLVSLQDISSQHVPEPEYWLPEARDKYLNSAGKIAINQVTRELDFEQIPVPLVDPINYPVVDHAASVKLIKNLFIDGYTFPKYAVINGILRKYNDNIDHLEHDESDYHPDKHGGSKIPEQFRNKPDRKVILPWLHHNVKTNLLSKPPMKEMELMYDDNMASDIKSDLLISAGIALQASRSFRHRQYSIEKGYIKPTLEDDEECLKFLKRRHDTLYRDFMIKKERLGEIKDYLPFSNLKEELADQKPIDVVRSLGGIATSIPWDYTHYIRGDATKNPQSKNIFKNPSLKKVLSIPNIRAA